MSSVGMIIIGAGHAAVRAALCLREAGYDGSVTLVAEEGTGAPYERPPLSKWLADSEFGKPIVPDDQLAAANIKRITARVSGIDPNGHCITLDGGQVLPYVRLLLATGASARRLDARLTNDAPVHYLRDLVDAQALRDRAKDTTSAIIIGGGFIGLELAASLSSMGIDVQVVEAADRLLSRGVTEPVAKIVQILHEAHGVKFHFGAGLALMEPRRIALSDGQALSADLIIGGIGSLPNTELAEGAGLVVENGIVVDTCLRTSDPDVFAAGDCCVFPLYDAQGPMTRLESWQAAGDMGALAGRNMVSAEQTGCTLTPWFWSEQYDHVLQVSGLPGPQKSTAERVYSADHHVSFGLTESGTLAFACGIAPGTKVAKDIRLAAKLIEAGIVLDQNQLEDPNVSLKSLLRG